MYSVTSDGLVTALYSFTNGVDGANPVGGLALGSDGFLYGTTSQGGTNDTGSGGDGTIFKMTTDGELVWSVSLDGQDGKAA